MKVVITPTAQTELAEIWKWNAKERGISHADSYVDFLKKSISSLDKIYARGKIVSVRPDFRYMLMKRRTGGHGHVVIYEIIGDEVTLLHIYHTAQNWQTRITEDAEQTRR